MMKLSQLLTEADALEKDQRLKALVVQDLPQFLNLFMKQIKADKYQEATQTLDKLSNACQEAKRLLEAQISTGTLQQPKEDLSGNKIKWGL